RPGQDGPLIDDQQIGAHAPGEAEETRVQALAIESVQNADALPQPARQKKITVIETGHLVPEARQCSRQVLRQGLEVRVVRPGQDGLHVDPAAPAAACEAAGPPARPAPGHAPDSALRSSRVTARSHTDRRSVADNSAIPSGTRRASAAVRVTTGRWRPRTDSRSAPPARSPPRPARNGAGTARPASRTSEGAIRNAPHARLADASTAAASAAAATPGAAKGAARAAARPTCPSEPRSAARASGSGRPIPRRT